MAQHGNVLKFRVIRAPDPPSWRERVERARVFLGIRATTIHIPEDEWMEHWRAGRNPAEAVLAELLRVA